MPSFAEVLDVVEGLAAEELQRFLDEAWVLPERREQRPEFSHVDVARVRLLVELRRDLAVEDETLPLVLGLLDQVYGLRHRLRQLLRAVEAQPPEVRLAIRLACREEGRD